MELAGRDLRAKASWWWWERGQVPDRHKFVEELQVAQQQLSR